MNDEDSRALLSLIIVLGVAFIGLFIGKLVGGMLKMRLQATDKPWLQGSDKIGGSAMAGVTLLIVVWLVSGLAAALPSQTVRVQVQESYIIRRLNTVLPGAPKVLTRLGNFINPNGFPMVFIGHEPALDTNTPLPPLGSMQTGVEATRPSVVKIAGRGCGGIVNGSGFVAGQGLVITNAHVVAGVARPGIVDGGGTHRAAVIWFDPDLDIAVLRAEGLTGKALPVLAEPAATGSAAAALGFPGGGEFTVSPATVLDSFTATGRNIYNEGTTRRTIYSLRTDIHPGDSGGPLINRDGAVIGVIFAASTTYDQVGYALTMPQVLEALQAARQRNQPVETGSCT